jgi:hypothetical protein
MYPKAMVNAQDWHYQFDLPESEECQTLEAFKQMITDFAEQGWEFAGAVTLKVDGGGSREHTVWKRRSSQ